MSYSLTAEEALFFKEHRYIHLANFLNLDEKEQLAVMTDELLAYPETKNKWMQYFETDSHQQRQLCRIENFLDYHDGFDDLARRDSTIKLVSTLMGEEAVLFKEKINVKLPGGQGFKAHQDAPAFITFNQTYHITLMVALDAQTLDNGCLQIASNYNKEQQTLNTNTDGSIVDEETKNITWQPILCQKGDVILFDSYVPHFSKENTSNQSRRALFITYSRLSEGKSMREAYFKHKREVFPPDCERIANKDYSEGAKIYNVANPIPVSQGVRG